MTITQYAGSDVAYLKRFMDQDSNIFDIADFDTLNFKVYLRGSDNLIAEYDLVPSGDQKQIFTHDAQTAKFYIEDTDITRGTSLDVVYTATVANVDITAQDLQTADTNIILVPKR